jgi:hypothetical protein
MPKKLFTFLITYAFIFSAYSQSCFESFLGYRANENGQTKDDTRPTLRQIHFGANYITPKKNNYENGYRINIALPFANNFVFDSSYTLNTNLPLNAPAKKTVQVYSFSASFIRKYLLFRVRKKNELNFLVNAGIAYQKIKVSYEYDKKNYLILNPVKTINSFGILLGFGLRYARVIKGNKIFIESVTDIPILTSKNKYPSPLKIIFPVGFNIGYSIALKNKQHAK